MIFLTGAAGFIGSNIFNDRRIKECGVIGCDDLSFGYSSNVHITCGEKFLEKDFNNLTNVELNSCDILIASHCSNIIYSQDNPVETFKNNALNTIRLFERFKGKIIYLSTSSVYNNASQIPTKEDSPIHCVNAYDTSKRIAELYLQKRGNFTTLRLNNTYGINQRPDSPYAGVLGKFIQCALDDKPMTIYGDGTDTRSYTCCDDVVSATIKAIGLPALNEEANIGSPEEISAMDLCRLVWKIVDKPVQYSIAKPRQIDSIKRRALDCTKAKELLGWEAKISLEEGIKKTILWQEDVRNS